MAETKPIILIVEDDLDVAEMLNAYFRVQGYECLVASWGEDALNLAESARPQLAILDIRLPDMDGYEVAQRLRASRNTRDLPIIFLTERRERADKLKGLEIGADDYLTKPFDVQELRLRVRNALSRRLQSSLTHPVTGLPDESLTAEQTAEALAQPQWAALLIRLLNLEVFRESYGFVAADDVLRAMAVMIYNALSEGENSKDFVGHLSAADFCILTQPDRAEDLQERLLRRLEQSLEYFYPLKDRLENAAARPERLKVHIASLNHKDITPRNPNELKDALLRRGQ